MLKILQLTDIHLFSDDQQLMFGVNTTQTFKAVLEAAREEIESSDFLVLSGDLIQDDKVSTYQCLVKLLRPIDIPIYWLPGNHDIPEIHQAFQGNNIYPDKVISQGKWQILLVDSTIPNEDNGELSQETVQWLEKHLAVSHQAGQHTLIILHHHPIPTESPWMDGCMLQNPEKLWELVERHSHIKGVVWGHVHQTYEGKNHQATLLASPSTCVQFVPKAKEFTVDSVGPGYRLLELGDEGKIRTVVKNL